MQVRDAPDVLEQRLSDLVDRLAGEVVLRHVAGRAVLDVGNGAKAVAEWVRTRASQLEVVDATSSALPYDDDSFEVAYCLRTLPHLGHDGASSQEAAKTLLRELGRVLIRGGIALVAIDNPRSLRGFLHGVRNPASVVETGALVVHGDHGLTRFDSIGRFVDLLPPTLEVSDIHGLCVFIPSAHVLGIPLIRHVVAGLEWRVRDRPLFRQLGGHLLVVLRALGEPAQSPAVVVDD